MSNNLEKEDQDKQMENIAEQDWPLLRELESTRFSLKNKKAPKRIRQSLQAVKEATEQEDKIISEQIIEDEKLVDAFLSVKPSNNDVHAPKEQQITHTAEVMDLVVQSASEKLNQEVHTSSSSAPEKVTKVNNAQSNVQPKQQDTEELSKLIARGMAKTYISKTDNILNPLRFIISNARQIGVALVQFIIPALITWYLTTNIQLISTELSKEPIHVHIVYIAIFYFACLFLWISGQVLFGGVLNLTKQAMTNLAKVGKT